MKKILKLIPLLVVIAFLSFIGWIGFAVYKDYTNDLPGKTEFEEANKKITTDGAGTFYGNSKDAEFIARAFSSQMKSLQAAMFSGGSGKSYASGGNFVTYCQKEDSGVALIVHVPELRNYEGEVLDALTALAWSAAQASLEEKEETKLIVGLRGFGSYGPVIEGTSKSESFSRTDGPGEEKRIYPYFPEVDGSLEEGT